MLCRRDVGPLGWGGKAGERGRRTLQTIWASKPEMPKSIWVHQGGEAVELIIEIDTETKPLWPARQGDPNPPGRAKTGNAGIEHRK